MKGKLGIDLKNINYDRVLGDIKPRKQDTVRNIIMSLGLISDKKKEDIERKLNRLYHRDLNTLYNLLQRDISELQKLNLVYQAMAKADEDRLIKERERSKNKIQFSEDFKRRVMPKLRELEIMARNGVVDMQSYMNFLKVLQAKLEDGKISLQEYEKQAERKVNEMLGIKDPNKKNDDLLMYGLIAIVGYLLYKNLK